MAERSALFEGQPLRRRGRSGRAAVAAVAVASTALLYGMGGAPRRGLESLRSSSSYKTDAMPRYSAKIWFDTPIQATDTLSIDVRNYDPYPSADASKAPDRVVLLMDDGTTRTLESNPWDCIYSSADYGSWGRRLFEIDGEMVDQYAVYYDFDQDVLAESFADDDYSGIAGMEFGGDGMQVAYSSIQLYVTNDAVRRRKLKASDVRRRLGAVAPDDSSVDYNGNTTVLFFGTIFDKDYAWYDSAGAAVENPYRAGSPSITAYSAATGNLPKRDAPYGGGSTARAASRGGLDPAAHGAESSPWREADTYRMSKYLTSVTVPDGVSGLDTCADTYLYTQSGTLTSETRYGYVSFVVPYVFDASDASETTFQNYDLSYFSISSDYATEYFTVNARMMAALYGTDSKNARGSWGSVFLVPQADWDACTAGTLELCTVDNELEPPHVEVDGEAVGFILPYGNLTIRYRDMNEGFLGSPDLAPCYAGTPADPNEPVDPSVMWDASLGKSWMPVEHYADFVDGDAFYAELRTLARATRAPALMLKRAPAAAALPKPAADDAPKTAALPVAFSVNEDKQRDYQTAECTWPDSTAFPSVLQKAAGFAVAGKPWGGVLLTDRGQYPALHGVENVGDYDPAEAYARIIDAYDDLRDACEADSSACAETFDVACRLSGDYDATLDCVEDCVEKPFRSFSSPDWTGPAATACDDPVLSAFELTPSIIKSCLDPTYDATEGGLYTMDATMGCYDCISGCIDLAEGTKRELKLESDCGLDEDGASIFA